jgi:outer membrane protein TolC
MGLRAAQTVRQLREQLDQALEGRKASLAQAQDYLDRLESAGRRITILDTAVTELRKSLEDMRRQRDMAQAREENEREKRIVAQKNLYRVMGWVDARLDKPPLLEDFGEVPF